MRPTRFFPLILGLFAAWGSTVGCAADPPTISPSAAGGAAPGATGGATGGSSPAATGGAAALATASGGTGSGSGGALPSGGVSPTGRAQTTGGAQATGGTTTGGTSSTGGNAPKGGAAGTHGSGAMGGVDDSGGAGPTGGVGTGGVPCPPAACGNANRENERCSDRDSVGLGKYQILTNLWGAKDTVETDGQCTWTLCDTQGKIAWGTEFTWTSGDEISVKSYAAAILGWHWSWMPEGTGLPLQLSEDRSIPCTWSFRLSVDEAASLNISWDLWLHPSPNVDNNSSPSDEIMVWVYRQNKEDPIGYEDGAQDTVSIGDSIWDLYRGNNGGNDVYSYLRTESADCATLDLKDFLDDLVAREWVDPGKYLISIESGPELVRGQGELITETYSCDVQ